MKSGNLILLFQVVFGVFLLFPCGLFSQESALSRLVNRVNDLKKISEDKQAQINALNVEIFTLTQNNANLSRQNKELRKLVTAKTQEIFELTGELSDITFEYQKLIVEIERLGEENEDFKAVVADIQNEKTVLQDSLASVMKLSDRLTLSLREKKYQAELLDAKNKALEDRIEVLVNYTSEVLGFEVFGNFNHSAGFTVMYGKISKGGNILYGAKTGFVIYPTGYNNVSRSSTVPIGLVLKVALDRRNKLGFSYVSICAPEERIRGFKWFGSLEANVAIPVGGSSDSRYNRPGLGALVGVGAIFDFNENVKPYLIAGIRFQELSKKDPTYTRQDFMVGFNLGAGVYF